MSLHPQPPAPADTGRHDFDFLVGTWTSQQRRLKAPLQGRDEWEHFSARCAMRRLPGGFANVDTLVAEDWRPGWVGMAFRVFNPVTQLWSIQWLTNEGAGIDASSGRLEAPVVGRFDGDIGLFEGDDVLDGRPIRVRFCWTRLGANAARWEQFFSEDAGQRWELNWVMDFERLTGDTAAGSASESSLGETPALDFGAEADLMELRQYTLHAGQRDTLVELFDRELVEAQEAVGMAVLGQFRDLDAPDRFVWLRGFADGDRRAEPLTAFYDGPVWQRHRAAANATMVDSDDVLLLRPAWPGAGISMRGRLRASGPVRMAPAGVVDAALLPLRAPASPALLDFCRDTLTPALQRAGAEVLGWYVPDPRPNGFPRHPVRQSGPMLAGFAMFKHAAALSAFTASPTWTQELLPALRDWLAGPITGLRLAPTARSAIHC